MTTTADSMGSLIAASARRGLGLVDALANNVPADRFARFIEIDGKPVVANHPAFCYGHLAIYPAFVLGALEGNPEPVATPEPWQELFKHGVDCVDDPDGSIYPVKDELIAATNTGYNAVLDRLSEVDETVLAKENPNESMRASFPTTGMMVNFMMTSHVMFHLGQVSTWRRCAGLGSAM